MTELISPFDKNKILELPVLFIFILPLNLLVPFTSSLYPASVVVPISTLPPTGFNASGQDTLADCLACK